MPLKFMNTRGSTNIKATTYGESQKEQRAQLINGKGNIRNTQGSITKQEEPDARMLRILSWKVEREIQKTVNLMRKKRPFLTGFAA